jgi:hypothetical protein
MSHYALIKNGLVSQVVVCDGDEAIDWLAQHLGGVWILGVKDKGLRAGIGYTYDEARDAFISPQPYPSWVLDEDTCLWVAPVPMPEDGDYTWNEDTQSWDAVSEA